MGRLPAESGARIVVINPQHPARAYAVSDAGVYRSDDAGRTWSRADVGLADRIVTLALDPRHPEQVYALSVTERLYQSGDGADSWRLLSRAGAVAAQ